MANALQSVFLCQVALCSRDLVVHAAYGDGMPSVGETLGAVVTGAIYGALMSLTHEEVYNIIQRSADEISGAICDGVREKVERRK